ncbi:MAG: hypothetical protein JOZ69_01540, partial [Myxococcales bacterium]|nr:hypothetical protein [Myxococcales bacterium]
MAGDPFWKGALLCGVLNALAVGAAVAVGLRARLAGRAELALSTLMTWNFLVMCPVYLLGLTQHLYARTLALVSAAFFLAVLGLARGRTPVRRFAAEIGRTVLEMAVLPFEAVLRCARTRSVVAPAVLFTFAFLLWSVWCA